MRSLLGLLLSTYCDNANDRDRDSKFWDRGIVDFIKSSIFLSMISASAKTLKFLSKWRGSDKQLANFEKRSTWVNWIFRLFFVFDNWEKIGLEIDERFWIYGTESTKIKILTLAEFVFRKPELTLILTCQTLNTSKIGTKWKNLMKSSKALPNSYILTTQIRQ